MKTIQFAILGTAIILTSCSAAKQTASTEYDDVYYNPNQAGEQAVLVETPQAAAEQVIVAQPMVQEQVYANTQATQNENLSDYELYRMQQEAEMLGETYEPQGSEALYANQYQAYDTLSQVSQYGQESAPVVINNYYSDKNKNNRKKKIACHKRVN